MPRSNDRYNKHRSDVYKKLDSPFRGKKSKERLRKHLTKISKLREPENKRQKAAQTAHKNEHRHTWNRHVGESLKAHGFKVISTGGGIDIHRRSHKTGDAQIAVHHHGHGTVELTHTGFDYGSGRTKNGVTVAHSDASYSGTKGHTKEHLVRHMIDSKVKRHNEVADAYAAKSNK